MGRILPSITAVFACLAVQQSFAQLPEFVQLPTYVPGSAVQLEKALILVRNGNTVECFSAHTRTWHRYSGISPQAAAMHDEYAIFRDGATYYGFGVRQCVFAPVVTTSPSPTLLTNANKWLGTLIDGSDVHLFNGYRGGWITYNLSGTPTVQTGAQAVIIGDSAGIRCVSALYDGTAIPLPAAMPTIGGASRYGCLAFSPGQVWGFSAWSNAWTSLAVPGSPAVLSVNANRTYFLIQESPTVYHFYSQHTGAFTTLSVNAGATVTQGITTCAIQDGNTLHLFESPRGSITTRNYAAPPLINVRDYYVMIDDGTNVEAYSARTGSFAPPLPGPLSLAYSTGMAAATPPGAGAPSHVYSAYVNAWTPAPPLATATSYLGTAGCSFVVLADPAGGLYGLSGIGTQWKVQASPPMTAVQSKQCIWAGHTGSTVYAFNPRLEQWFVQPLASTVKQWDCFANSVLVTDGLYAYGCSTYTDGWSVTPVLGPAVAIAGQQMIEYMTDGSKLYAYGNAAPQLAIAAEFPWFYREMSSGGVLRCDLGAEPFSQSVIYGSLGPANVSLPPYGTLRIDPATAFPISYLTHPAVGTGWLEAPIPNDPALVGARVYIQGFVFGGPNGGYLTDSVRLSIY